MTHFSQLGSASQMVDNFPKRHYQLGSKCSKTIRDILIQTTKGGPARSMTDRDGHGGSEHPNVKELQKPYLLTLLREIFKDYE